MNSSFSTASNKPLESKKSPTKTEILFFHRELIEKKPLRKLANYMQDHRILVGGVESGGEWQVAVGDTYIQPGDRVIAVCPSLNLNDLRRLFQ